MNTQRILVRIAIWSSVVLFATALLLVVLVVILYSDRWQPVWRYLTVGVGDTFRVLAFIALLGDSVLLVKFRKDDSAFPIIGAVVLSFLALVTWIFLYPEPVNLGAFSTE